MRFSSALLFIAAGALPAFADDPAEWKEFASKEGRFTVLMAGTPKQRQLDTESDFGNGVLNMNQIRVGRSMFAANYCDYPPEVKKAALKQMYDSARDGAIENMQGKFVAEKDIKLGDYPGREIRIDVGEGKALFRARVFLVEQRLYQAVVFGPPDAAVSKEADRFLDSFKLTGK